jgi:hypothetical protein
MFYNVQMTVAVRYQLSTFENSQQKSISSTDPHFGDSIPTYVVDICAK